MAQYAGLSLREIYEKKCQEYECKKNSMLLATLPNRPNQFDVPTSIDVSKNFLGPKGLRALLEVVRCATNLKYLDLRDQQMTKEVVDELCAILLNHPSVIRVNLSENPLTIASGSALLELAKHNTTIEYIVLENTQIRPVMTNAIAAQLAKNKQQKAAVLEAIAQQAAAAQMLVGGERPAAAPVTAVDQHIIRGALSSYPHSICDVLFDENPSSALITLCGQLNGYFVDTQFLPDELSIQKVTSAHYDVSHWSRIGDINKKAQLFPDDVNLVFPSKPRPSFSWLFVALGAIVEPAYIRALITPQQLNPAGVYTVKVFVDGAWRFVVVNDCLPMTKDGECAFTGPAEDRYFWPCILEKAAAKIHGGYQALDHSVTLRHPSERKAVCSTTMADFSGGIGISRDLHHEEFNAEEWWSTLLDLHGCRASIVGTSAGDDAMLSQHGIDTRHSYEVVQVKQINGYRLLLLRSPWATRTWNGDWSAKSPLWEQNPGIATALADPNLVGNTFWMPYVKFLQCFGSMHVCRLFPNTNSRVIDGQWGADFCGGPYFDPLWVQNPRYRVSFAGSGAAFINLSLPDGRFTSSDIETLAFHVLRGETFPIRFDKDAVVARTSYVITSSVSYDGTFAEGDYWLVPSTYVPGKAGSFVLRLFSTAPFMIRHENIREYWSEITHQTFVENSGEYQSGEDNAQFALEFPQNEASDGSGQSGRVLIKLHTPETDQLSLAIFLVDASDRKRLVGPIPEEKVVARSKFVISNTVYLEAYIPANVSRYIIVTCLNPERSQANVTLTAWSSIHKFHLMPLPFWKKKVVRCEWVASGAYQESARNPQLELITAQGNQTFVVRVQVSGCTDPSLVFFVVGNRDRVGEGLRGKIPDERILARSTYIRYDSVVKEFSVGAVPLNSYLIVPCLQPPGSRGSCTVTVSCVSDDFTLRLLQNGE